MAIYRKSAASKRVVGSIRESPDIRLVRLYAFADRFFIPELKPAVMDLLVQFYNIFRVPQYRVIIYAFDKLPNQSPVLRLLVDAQDHLR